MEIIFFCSTAYRHTLDIQSVAFILHRIAGVLQGICTTRNDVTVCNTTFPIVWAVGKHCNLQLIDFVGCYKTFIESVHVSTCQ